MDEDCQMSGEDLRRQLIRIHLMDSAKANIAIHGYQKTPAFKKCPIIRHPALSACFFGISARVNSVDPNSKQKSAISSPEGIRLLRLDVCEMQNLLSSSTGTGDCYL